jgi:hypothetical protein
MANPVCNSPGLSARLSGVAGAINGLIVVKINGEGRGVACRVMKPSKKHETKHRS